tara:strand:- start:40 stop:432 length:393 start_codon:yes stop_codon:yes gene_type:complete
MPEGTGTYGKQRGRPSKAAKAEKSPKAKPVGTHKMPDGTVMSGKTHSKDSKPKPKMGKVTIQGKDIPIKTGALSKMLRIPEEENIPMTLLRRLNKMEIGEEFEQKGKSMKMTGLLKKRVSLAITLKKMKK